MRASALALVLTAALLAGCGSSGKAAKPNNEASKPADRVFADAQAAATAAHSAHVAGKVFSGRTPVTLDLDIARAEGAKGSMTIGGLPFDVVRIGDTAYIHGSDAFWRRYAGATIAQLLHGRWVKGSVRQQRFRSIVPLTSVGLIFERVRSRHGKLVNKGKTTYKGNQVVAVRDKSDNSTLYVAATGKPYPVAIVGTQNREPVTITFNDWNKGVSLSAPSNAVDATLLGG